MGKVRIIFYIGLVIIIIIAIWIISNNNVNIGNVESLMYKQKISNDLTIGFTNYDTLNPILTKSKEIQYLSKLVYEPLINITEDFRLEASIAEEWSKLDSTTYIIKMDPNKYWQNGEKIDAWDVKFTIDNLKNIDTVYSYNINAMKEIEIIDENTLKIYLLNEVPFFEYFLCIPILPENVINEKLEIQGQDIIGSGQYKYIKIENEKIELQHVNNNKKIIIKLYDSNVKLYNAFTNYEVDIITTENYNYPQYIGNIGYEEVKITGRNLWYLELNINNEYLRSAVKHAINSRDVVYNVYNDKYVVTIYPLNYGSYLQNLNDGLAIYDKEKAEEELMAIHESNEVIKNNKNMKINLYINSEQLELGRILAENIASIGIKCDIKFWNGSEYDSIIDKTKNSIILHEKTMSIFPDMNEFFDISNENIKRNMEEIKNITNEEILKEKYELLADIYFKENRNLSICFDSIFILHSNNIVGDFRGNWYNLFYNIDTWCKIL